MLSFVFLVVLGLSAFGLYRYFHARQVKRDGILASLNAAARALGGHIEQREHARKQRVLFSEQGYHFALSREAAASEESSMRDMFVVEVMPVADNKNSFDLRGADAKLLPPASDDESGENLATKAAEQSFHFVGDDEAKYIFSQKIQDSDTRQLLNYALDHKDAHLHFSPTGQWFECAGFASNGEMAAATARTAARALAVFLSSDQQKLDKKK